MGGGKDGTPTKQSKPTSSAQETPTTPSYQDWSNSMQAYYGAAGTPPFFASPVASPTPHPYLWGGQHHLMPPYGTPVPYQALYPPGGVYAHPAMATNPSLAPTNVESEGKTTEAKDRTPNKKSKGISGVGSKAGESVNAASSSGNDGATQSAETGSDGSSDASDDNENLHGFSGSKKGSFHQMLADGANAHSNIGGPPNIQSSVVGNPVSVAATNLNMGMDLWNPSSAGNGSMKMRPNPSGASPTVSPGALIGHDGTIPEQWGQDERELKRQKRKQSNRESARRSRLRKQAECEELQARVESLNNDNNTLRDELQRLSEECQKLTSENDSIQEELTKLFGADEISKLENASTAPLLQSHGDEGNN